MNLVVWIAIMREWLVRLIGTFRRRSDESELRGELAHHLELVEERLRRRGYSPAEAKRLARAQVGQPEKVIEQLREQHGIPWFGIFTLDVRLGLRMLRKHLGLTLIGGLAMSVGFGIAVAVFWYFDVIVWADSVPLDDGDRVVAIQIWDAENSRRSEISMADFERWRTALASIESLGAFRTVERDIVHPDGRTESVSVAEVSAAGFRVARKAPLLGRTLLPEDERAGAEAVIVIGYDEWQSRFNGETDIVGRTIRLDDGVHTIVGVMAEDFGFPINHRFWTPLQLTSQESLPAPPAGAAYGRLAAGVTLAAARAELAAVGLLQPDVAERTEPLRLTVVPYAANFISDTNPDDVARKGWNARLVMLLVVLLLIPPCTNIAMLVYARTVSRQEEIAVRTVLGASRGRIVLQLFIEMLVLSTLAVGLALVAVRFIATFVNRAMTQQLERLPFWISFDLSANTLLFAASLAVFAALVIGVLPALKATSTYKHPGLSALERRHRLRLGPLFTLLIVVQVAFSFAGLPTAVELGWGVLRSELLGPGFAADQYLTARFSLEVDDPPRPREDDTQFSVRFRNDLDALVRRLETDARVSSQVTTASAVPGEGRWMRFKVGAAEEPAAESDKPGLQIGVPLAQQLSIDDKYFEVFEVPVLTGRGFRSGESSDASRAVLVNATFARDVFGDANPLGRRLSYERAAEGPWYEIVGVVADRPAHPFSGSVFHAAGDGPLYPASLSFRLGANASSLREELEQMADAIDPALRVERVVTLREIYDTQAFGNYIGGFAIVTASLSVLLLAAAGIYALMSFTVNQRRREIAIRIALGAQPRKLLSGIFMRALRQISTGAALGFGVALLVQYYIPAHSFGGLDVPGVLPSAIVLLLVIGTLATFGPARRALTADPTEALREAG